MAVHVSVEICTAIHTAMKGVSQLVSRSTRFQVSLLELVSVRIRAVVRVGIRLRS